MNSRKEIIGLTAFSVLFLGACNPEAGQQTDTEAEAAEAPATQRPATGFEDWDANQDQALQVEEFNTWASDEDLLADWTGEEGLDRERFNERMIEVWDTNDDDQITESEWQAGVSNLYGNTDYGTFSQWDMNGDGHLDAEEVTQGNQQFGLYTRMDGDQDGVIDDVEIGDFFFDLFDVNDDNQLDSTEWDYGRQNWFEDNM